MSIESFVDQAMSLSKRKEHDQLEILFIKHLEILIKNPRSWGSILELARSDPVANTMLLAVVGGLRATQNDADVKMHIVGVTEMIVKHGDPRQLLKRELVLSQFRNLVHRYVGIMREAKEIKRALRILDEGLNSGFVPVNQLSAFHPGFVQLCLLAQNPNAALPLLSLSIVDIDPSSTGVKAVDYMAYYYYGGIAYLALQDIPKAREFFRNVFAVPAQAVSVVMVLAFKALTLINAISEPRPVTFPNHIDARHERTIRQIATPYTDLVAALESRDDAAVAKILEAERATWEADDLGGLVQQALDAAPRQAILALTRIYVALTLDQIAEQVKVPKQEVEQLLGSMIARGSIDATIDAAGTVKFLQGRVPELDEIAEDLLRAQELSQQIREIDDTVVTSKSYVMAKLRQMPNLREILADYETKRKANRSLAETMHEAFRGGAM